jgi:hypothetical protein
MNGFSDGIIGFLLFFAHWLSPQTGKASVDADYVKLREPHCIVFKCKMDIAWNTQLEQLVDAGIPLNFKICWLVNSPDTISFVRSLHFNMVDYTYHFTDSVTGILKSSSDYSLVHLALRDFCKWEIVVPDSAPFCKVIVLILPSKAEQLNRMVDMSRVWGQQHIAISFNPLDKIPVKRTKSRGK